MLDDSENSSLCPFLGVFNSSWFFRFFFNKNAWFVAKTTCLTSSSKCKRKMVVCLYFFKGFSNNICNRRIHCVTTCKDLCMQWTLHKHRETHTTVCAYLIVITHQNFSENKYKKGKWIINFFYLSQDISVLMHVKIFVKVSAMSDLNPQIPTTPLPCEC